MRENSATESWRHEAAALGGRTARADIIARHPDIARLYALVERPDADRPAPLRGVDLAELVGLAVVDRDFRSDRGPDSDFDPANSVPFCWVDGESIWYSVLTLPGTPVERWPVVECEPAGRDNVVPVALSVADFLHDWFVADGPYGLSPLKNVADDRIDALLSMLSEHLAVDPRAARRALDADRADADPARFAPRARPAELTILRALVVPRDH